MPPRRAIRPDRRRFSLACAVACLPGLPARAATADTPHPAPSAPRAPDTPGADAGPSAADRAFDALAQQVFDERMALDPLSAAVLLGDAGFAGQMRITIAPAERAQAQAQTRRHSQALAQLAPAALSPGRRLSHQLLGLELDQARASEPFRDDWLPLDPDGGLPVWLASLGGGGQGQPLDNAQDYRHYLQRLLQLPAYVHQAIANMQQGLRQGISLPRSLMTTTLASLRPLAEPDFTRSPFSQALRQWPEAVPAAERAALQRDYQRAFQRHILPAMQQLLAYAQGPYRAACRRSDGYGELPDGRAWYQYLVQVQTGSTLAPEAIHALGLDEVARIQAAIAALQPGFGFSGPVSAFLQWQQVQSRFRPFRTWDDLLAGYRAINARAEPLLPGLFGRRPAQPLEVREMPELQRGSSGPYYLPPAADGSRPGIFFAGEVGGPAQSNVALMTATLLHEGQPGHHLQIGLQQALALPDFRRHGWHNAFGEGWALYAEGLGHEMGLYEDPVQHLGQLRQELVRAVRLVVDTGLHARRWRHADSLRYIMQTEGVDEATARQATERYMAYPAQALGYKLGQMDFQRLRREAEAGLGRRFDVRHFHDRVLGQGSLPMGVLAARVAAWVAEGGPAEPSEPAR